MVFGSKVFEPRNSLVRRMHGQYGWRATDFVVGGIACMIQAFSFWRVSLSILSGIFQPPARFPPYDNSQRFAEPGNCSLLRSEAAVHFHLAQGSCCCADGASGPALRVFTPVFEAGCSMEKRSLSTGVRVIDVEGVT